MSDNIDISELRYKTIKAVEGLEEGSGSVRFITALDEVYELYHEQDCCEHVSVNEVIGDVQDLIGEVLVEAEEVSSNYHPAPSNSESYTWTFYKLGTRKGSVTIRWLGESNGYYSESVYFRKVRGAPSVEILES